MKEKGKISEEEVEKITSRINGTLDISFPGLFRNSAESSGSARLSLHALACVNILGHYSPRRHPGFLQGAFS